MEKGPLRTLLHPWPVPLPRDWLQRVQRPETEAELEAVRRAIHTDHPFGTKIWQAATARKLGLEFTFRQRDRPRKEEAEDD